MGRRKNETAIGLGAILVLGAIAFCCGGPLALVNSVSTPDRTTPTPKRTSPPTVRRAKQQVLAQEQPPAARSFSTSRDVAETPAPVEAPKLVPSIEPPAESRSAPPVNPEPEKQSVATPDIFRKWTDSTGMFTVVAVVARFDTKKAKLQREDGKVITLPLEQLSDADRDYLGSLKSVPTNLSGAKTALGKAVGVTDGDTIKLFDEDKGNYTIRLEGIDAPEAHQAFGTQAKKALSDKVFGKVVRVEWKETDKYGRTLGHVYLGTQHINLELLNEGMAWHYKKYSSDRELADAEQRARDKKIGLWRKADPVPPWDFRNGVEVAVAPKPFESSFPPSEMPATFVATVYVTKSGSHYHLSGCRHLSKSKIPISLAAAQAGYSRCSVCKPP